VPKVEAIEFHAPDQVLDNIEISKRFPKWTPDKILEKTGISQRRVARVNETAADLATEAASKLFSRHEISSQCIDMLIFVSQSPNQLIPTTSCEIHASLGLRSDCGAFDVNQGCSGYLYGLMLAKSMIQSSSMKNILLLTGDTYSKIIDPEDASLLTLFGDGASATLIAKSSSERDVKIGPFLFGIDGSKANYLHCYRDGFKKHSPDVDDYLSMNGAGIMSFTLDKVPSAISMYLSKNELTLEDFDYVLLHQANKFILDKLYLKLLASEKGVVSMSNYGNTVSTSIPCALSEMLVKQSNNPLRILLAGYGVGLSWGVTWVEV